MTDSAQVRIPTLTALIQQVEAIHPDGDPVVRVMDAVTTASGITDLADHLIGHFVDAARAAGASWAQIGEGLGVSKQAVQQRFVPREPGTVADFENSFTLPAKGKFHRYTDRSKNCVFAAEEIARSASNTEVGPIHLLLGLFADPESLAVRALAALGADPEEVRKAAVRLLPPMEHRMEGPIPFRTEGRKVLDLAVRESLRLGHNYVGTEHVLLALLAEENSPAAEVLAGAGVTHESVSAEVERMLAELLEQHRARRSAK